MKALQRKRVFKEGDIITKIGDTKIEDPDQLSQTVRKQKPVDKVTITVLRDKKEQKITRSLGKWKGVSGFSFAPGKDFKMDMDYNEMLAPKVQVAPRIRYGQAMVKWCSKIRFISAGYDDGKGVKVLEVDEESNAQKRD
jgi:serine protease Do